MAGRWPELLTSAGAEGLCYLASVTVAKQAGDRLRLVEFDVTDDHRFVNHYGIDIGGGWVFDPTAAQLKDMKRAGPLVKLSDYPPNVQPSGRVFEIDDEADFSDELAMFLAFRRQQRRGDLIYFVGMAAIACGLGGALVISLLDGVACAVAGAAAVTLVFLGGDVLRLWRVRRLRSTA